MAPRLCLEIPPISAPLNVGCRCASDSEAMESISSVVAEKARNCGARDFRIFWRSAELQRKLGLGEQIGRAVAVAVAGFRARSLGAADSGALERTPAVEKGPRGAAWLGLLRLEPEVQSALWQYEGELAVDSRQSSTPVSPKREFWRTCLEISPYVGPYSGISPVRRPVFNHKKSRLRVLFARFARFATT